MLPSSATLSVAAFFALIATIMPFCARAQDLESPANAEAIFERASAVWARMSYPSQLDYKIAVRLEANGSRKTDHYDGEVESATGECRVHAFSAEESANPYVPHGTNVRLSLSVGASSGGGGPGAAPPAQVSVISTIVNSPKIISFGVPMISPLYSFGIRSSDQRVDEHEDSSGPKTIGRVSTVRRRYTVRLIEQTSLDGVEVYHLGLDPLADPARDRLRELWIDTQTYAVVQARIAGNFVQKPATAVPWLIRFRTIDGATYILSETAERPMPNKPVAFDAVAISFGDFEQRHGSPDLLFALPNDLNAPGHVFEPNENGGRGIAHSC